jgi:hypothetical protein
VSLAAGATARIKIVRIEGNPARLAAALLVLAEESA